MLEVRRRKTEVGSWEFEDGRRKTEVEKQETKNSQQLKAKS